ncbi:MAG: carboxypeptidase regulatory-like domain-containing protein [bacterium]
MKQTITRWFAVLGCFMIFTSAIFAQGATNAAINGTIKSTSGEVLPGATIMAVHNPSGTTYGTSSRVDGRYNIPNLRVGGPYTITVSYIGYAQQKREDVNLQLSQDQTLNFVMSETAVQLGEVQIVGERGSIMSAARTGAATNVTRAQMDRLPTISRSFQDYYKVSPYFTGVGSNAVGRNNRYNNIQIDGANFNDLFGLGATGTPGGQGGTTPISLEAIEEFQIVVSPFDVRNSNFTGAGINAITRSGTNTLKGSAFYMTRNQSLAGVSPDALKAKLPDFTTKSYGVRLGGPIIENKLFFFGAAELARSGAPFTRTFNQKAFGTNSYTANSDSLRILSDFLKSKYGYETGSWSTIPRDDNSDKFFLRFDYNLSESHKLTARWNYLTASTHNSPSRFRGTFDVYSENAAYQLDNTTNSFALQLTSLFGNTVSNELIIGYNNQLDKPVYKGQPFPTVEIRTVGSTPGTVTTENRLAVGAEEFRHYNELEQDVIEITDNLSLYLKDHTITVGAKVDLLQFRNLFISDGFGWYQYNSLAAFMAGGKAASYLFKYSATSNPQQEANWGYRQLGFYVQDEWTVSPRLKIVGGVRFDIPTYPDKPNNNPTFETAFSSMGLKTSEPPKTAIAISPRIGFNWAVDEERNTQLRGGVGIFYGRYPAVWVSNQYSNTGVDFYSTTVAPNTFIADPYNQPKIATGLPTAEVNMTDPNFKAPSVMRFSIGLDQKLPFDIVASVEGIYSKNMNEVYYQNILMAGLQSNNGLTPGGRLVGEGREVWSLINATTGAYTGTRPLPLSTAFTGVYYVTNTDQGSMSNIVVQLQRQNNTDGIYANIGYNYGISKDIGGTNSTTASSGWRYNPTKGNPNQPVLSYSDADRTHRIFGTVSYRYDWNMFGLATTVGVFYNGLSGSPFSYIVNGDVNGDGRSDNDLMFIPKSASDIILLTSSGAAAPQADYDALMAYIDSDAYLKEHKGEFAERNAARSPWSHRIDFRVTQEVGTIMGHKLEFVFDVENAMNMIDDESGWVKVAAQQVPLVTFHSVTPTGANAGKARYRWTGMSDPSVASNTASRWSGNFGIRYTF